jgi:hypothetical protein
MTRGVYRTFNVESGGRYAHVEYDTHADMDISEQRYRDRGYPPAYETLPWKDEYDAAKATMATETSNDASPPQQA